MISEANLYSELPSCFIIQAQLTDFNKYSADFIRWIKCNDHTIQNNIYNVHILPSIKPEYFENELIESHTHMP